MTGNTPSRFHGRSTTHHLLHSRCIRQENPIGIVTTVNSIKGQTDNVDKC